MYIDRENQFCWDQTIDSVGDHPSTDTIDLAHGGDAIEQELWIEILVSEAFATSTGGTAQFKLQTDSDQAFGTPKDLMITGAIPAATLAAGYKPILARMPLGCERYLRVLSIVGTGAMTAGKIRAFLTPLPQTNKNTFSA